MTVQELIDVLLNIEDKTKTVTVFSEGTSEDAEYVSEYDDSIMIY